MYFTLLQVNWVNIHSWPILGFSCSCNVSVPFLPIMKWVYALLKWYDKLNHLTRMRPFRTKLCLYLEAFFCDREKRRVRKSWIWCSTNVKLVSCAYLYTPRSACQFYFNIAFAMNKMCCKCTLAPVTRSSPHNNITQSINGFHKASAKSLTQMVILRVFYTWHNGNDNSWERKRSNKFLQKLFKCFFATLRSTCFYFYRENCLPTPDLIMATHALIP